MFGEIILSCRIDLYEYYSVDDGCAQMAVDSMFHFKWGIDIKQITWAKQLNTTVFTCNSSISIVRVYVVNCWSIMAVYYPRNNLCFFWDFCGYVQKKQTKHQHEPITDY